MASDPTHLLTAKQVRARFGNISDMTLWRWLADESLGFPRPVVIQKRRYFRVAEIEEFETRQAAARAA